MSATKLAYDDPRVERKTVQVRGQKYSYLDGQPTSSSTSPKGTVVLIHGFPDLSYGWRYQIPFFQSQGFRVLAPDMLGYAGTDAPDDPARYSLKNSSDDVAALCASVLGPGERIILGGHDWGGFLVWRIALWHPNLVRGVFSIATPYAAPNPRFFDIADMVASGRAPTLEYQLQFRSGELEKHTATEEGVREFFKAVTGARGPKGQSPLSIKGFNFSLFGKLGKSPLLSDEELDAYVSAFAPKGLKGPTNWYRMRKPTFEEELPLIEGGKKPKIAVPCLFLPCSHDRMLPPSMAKGMDQHFDDLTIQEVPTHHWAMAEAPEHVNKLLKEWIEEKFERKHKASL